MTQPNSHYPRFHLALPVTDLDRTRDFYEKLLGCGTGRESQRWVDLDFFGHQLVLHLVNPGDHPAAATNPVDGHQVPAAHFGPVLAWADWESLADRLKSLGVEFLIEPTVRFRGQAGEQATMFVRDPSGNCLEFKAMRHPEQLFARDPS